MSAMDYAYKFCWESQCKRGVSDFTHEEEKEISMVEILNIRVQSIILDF
jgi:hypothetical protein